MSWQPVLGQYQWGLISSQLFCLILTFHIPCFEPRPRGAAHICAFGGFVGLKKMAPPFTWATLIKAVARGRRGSEDFHAAPSSLSTFTTIALQQPKRSFATGGKQASTSS